jgi:hypothetical protein
MVGFLGAHGYEPGPTQRPLIAGAIGGMVATAPAIALLHAAGSLQVEARIVGLSVVATIVAGWLLMAAAGSAYARLFGRAANDSRGGWLFGMMFGFGLWAAGAVFVLALAGNGQLPAGNPAAGVFLSLVLWGGTLGAILPFIHRRMHRSIDEPGLADKLGAAVAAPHVLRRKAPVQPASENVPRE